MRLTSARDAKSDLLEELERGITVAAGDSGGAPPPNVAVGISPRPGRQFAVAVRAQTLTSAGPDAQIVAGWVDRYGDDLDIRVIGEVVKQQQPVPWYRQRIRPIRPGASVAHLDVTAGTIGTFVRRASGGAVEVLSNNHVLADENQAALGDQILQPGPYDGGSVPDDVIGTLAAFTPVDVDGPNVVDCATSSIDEEIGWSLETFDAEGGLTGLLDLNADEDGDDGEDGDELPPVAKHGRTTGRTDGTITAIELDNLQVRYDIGVVRFDDQIEVTGSSGPFSQGGDSGSLVIALPGAGGAGAGPSGCCSPGARPGGPAGAG